MDTLRKSAPLLWEFLSIIKGIIQNRILLKLIFYRVTGYKLNLNNPKTFNGKIQFRKKYGNHDFMAMIADKYRVRSYVKEKIGAEYLVPLYGTYNEINIDDLLKLPQKFVIKTNHGSGLSHLEIVMDKSQKDLNKLAKKMNRALKMKMGFKSKEIFYDKIEPKIIVEQFLGTVDEIPEDYKFHIFNYKNKDTKLFIQIDKGRFGKHFKSIYAEGLSELEMTQGPNVPPLKDWIFPQEIVKMIELAKKLSEDFDYVRVDFYLVGGKIYFGELTQTHNNGMYRFHPKEYDLKWGELWEVDYSNEKLYIKKNPLNNK